MLLFESGKFGYFSDPDLRIFCSGDRALSLPFFTTPRLVVLTQMATRGGGPAGLIFPVSDGEHVAGTSLVVGAGFTTGDSIGVHGTSPGEVSGF